MPRDTWAEAAGAKIGPNTILQLIPVLDAEIGPQARMDWMRQIGVDVPSGTGMIPEGPAAQMHSAMRATFGDRAPGLLARAGQATGGYILAHRIPAPAQTLLRLLPAGLAARLLSKAIAKHAWTFVGSGQFRVVDPWTFEIAQNPVIASEQTDAPLCHWHVAVFETLYRALVHPGARCRETACAGMGDGVCRFTLSR